MAKGKTVEQYGEGEGKSGQGEDRNEGAGLEHLSTCFIHHRSVAQKPVSLTLG